MCICTNNFEDDFINDYMYLLILFFFLQLISHRIRYSHIETYTQLML